MKRVLGLDLGTKTLGIAISDPTQFLSTGLENFRFKENHFQHALDYLKQLLEQYQIEEIVLSYPKHMNGDEGDACLRSKRFKEKIECQLNIKVVLWDERLTSRQANLVMLETNTSRKKRKEKIDQLAATILLQSYLDCKRSGGIK